MKNFIVSVFAVTLVLFAGSVHADILTFDDIGTGGDVYNGYGGLNWDEMGYLNASGRTDGYGNGLVSGDYVAFNQWAHVAAITDGVFDWNGAYFTGAWRDGLNITATGYLDGDELYRETIVVDSTSANYFTFDFFGIDALQLESFGGVEVEGYRGSGAHFAMDNFTFNEEPSEVPEPATVFLFGTGLFGLAAISRRTRKN